MYLSFVKYQEYGGAADKNAFNRLNFRAEKILDRFTQKRVSCMAEVPESVERCLTELIDGMNATDPTQTAVNPVLTGFSNDGYSESYGVPVSAESLETAYYGIIRDYLSMEKDDQGTPLLYAGVCV